MLVPAGILVLLVLGSIAVDSAIVLLAQRDLANRTAAAANDIAGATVSDASFYLGGTVELDPRRADAYARLVFAPDRRPDGYDSWTGSATTAGRSVTVVARAEVRYIFAPAIPGARSRATVTARSTASAVGG